MWGQMGGNSFRLAWEADVEALQLHPVGGGQGSVN